MSTNLDPKRSKNIGLMSISHFGIFMAGHTSKRTLKTCHIPSLFQSCHIHDSPHLKSALYTVVFDFLAAAKSRLLAQSLLHTCTAFWRFLLKRSKTCTKLAERTHWQSVIPLQAASTCGRWSVNLWQRAAELHHFKKYPVHGRASSPLHSNNSREIHARDV